MLVYTKRLIYNVNKKLLFIQNVFGVFVCCHHWDNGSTFARTHRTFHWKMCNNTTAQQVFVLLLFHSVLHESVKINKRKHFLFPFFCACSLLTFVNHISSLALFFSAFFHAAPADRQWHIGWRRGLRNFLWIYCRKSYVSNDLKKTIHHTMMISVRQKC